MRAGYAARGVVYVLIGGIALLAAWSGGQAEGPKGALFSLRDEPWGMAMLAVIGLGFFCYAAWRVMAAWMDLERHGSNAKGMLARAALVVTGVVHAALGIYALRLAVANSSGSEDGQSEQRWTAWLMSQPFGKWLVIAVGLIVIGAGVYYAWKGIGEKYKEHLRYTPTVERLDPLCKFGLVAYGLVIGIIGGFLIWAGWTSDPSEAGGIEQALATVHQAAFGRVLLGILGLGMIAFAFENFIEAIYRVVPAAAGPGVTTWASRAQRAASAAGARLR